jgi:putative ABC transport system permease protein
MLKELVTIAVQNIFKRKLRSFLTLLGVVIGVAAIIGMVGAVQGISQMITGQVEKFQSDVITILPGQLKFSFTSFGGAQKTAQLTDKDVNEIKKVPGVEIVGGVISKRMTVEFEGEQMTISVVGIGPEVLKATETLGLSDGRYLDSNDGHAAVIGYSVANDIFKNNIELKKKFTIDGEEYKVVGILNKAGGMLQTIDTMIYIPQDVMKNDFSLGDNFDQIDVKISEGADSKQVANDIDTLLTKLHKVKQDEKDFTLITPEFTQQITSQITGLMQVLIGGIAGISLIVGAIGISNMMFTSVLERTREIGILKALGATNRHILTLFLMEAGIIGIVGGIIGILFGYVLGEGVLVIRQVLVARAGLSTGMAMPYVLLTPQLVFGTLIFSLAVGVLAGYFPARRASKLQPVEALRYE